MNVRDRVKTTERLGGPALIQRMTSDTESNEFIYNADPLGVWIEGNVFLPWTSIEWIKPL